MKIKPFVMTAGILVLCVSSLLLVQHYSHVLASSDVFPEPEITIEASYPQQTLYQPIRTITGQTRAVQETLIKNELAGKITKLNFTSGQLVVKHQTLIEIDHKEEDASLRATLADVALYKRKLGRLQSLHSTGQISDEEVDDVQAQLTKTTAEVERIKAVIDKKIIVAPFSGYTSIHNLTIGQYLDINSEITSLIGNDDFIWVDFNIPQIYQALEIGDKVKISIKGRRHQARAAEITSVSPALEADTRQLKYRAKISNSTSQLRPNQLVNVLVPTTAKSKVLLIPNQAVIRDLLGDYVYQLQRDEKTPNSSYRATIAKVELGDTMADKIVVLEGINARSMIATKGAFKLWPGAKTAFTLPENNAGDR